MLAASIATLRGGRLGSVDLRFRAAEFATSCSSSFAFPTRGSSCSNRTFAPRRRSRRRERVIARNGAGTRRNLFTDGDEGEKISSTGGRRVRRGRWVASELRRLRSEHGLVGTIWRSSIETKPKSGLGRGDASRERAVMRVSGMRFYDRKEIKNALAYARLLVIQRRGLARRVINEPSAGWAKRRRPNRRLRASTDSRSPKRRTTGGRGSERGERSRAGEVLLHARRTEALSNDLSPRELIDAIVREWAWGRAAREDNRRG